MLAASEKLDILIIKTISYCNSSERPGLLWTSLERLSTFKPQRYRWRHPHAVLSQMQPKPVIAAGVFVLVPTAPRRDENGGRMVLHDCRTWTLARLQPRAGWTQL